MHIPRWFVRELEIIDPTYYVVPNEEYQYYEIKRKIEISRTDRESANHILIYHPTVAVFKTLNEDALLSLRKRKYIGLKFRQNMREYAKSIVRENKEAKKKAIEIARERTAEGLIRIFNWGRKKYYLTAEKNKGG